MLKGDFYFGFCFLNFITNRSLQAYWIRQYFRPSSHFSRSLTHMTQFPNGAVSFSFQRHMLFFFSRLTDYLTISFCIFPKPLIKPLLLNLRIFIRGASKATKIGR